MPRSRGGAREPRSSQRGIELLPTFDDVVAVSDTILSIVPPGAALEVADAVARSAERAGTRPLVADLNAIAPATMHAVANRLGEVGLVAVDGSISGPPPRLAGTTIVYLSGGRAAEVASLDAPGLELRVVGDAIGTASAIKMSTASFYKGQTALFRPGASRRADERGPRARARRPPPALPRLRRRRAAPAPEHCRQVGPLRRRDGGDRRDPGAGGADTGSVHGVRRRLPRAQPHRGGGPHAGGASTPTHASRTSSPTSTRLAGS